MSKILAILAALAKLFFMVDKERSKAQGAQELSDKLKAVQDEKIKDANNVASGDLSDELLLAPKDRGKK